MTNYCHNLYDMDLWASRLESENPLLAEQMHDLYRLLDRYDYYLSGDIGEDAIQEAWEEYRTKWIDMDTDKVVEILFGKCIELVDGAVKGCKDVS